MSDNEILDYISYFDNEKNVYCTWKSSTWESEELMTMGYPIYDRKLTEFISEVYKSNLLATNYTDYLDGDLSQLTVEKIKGADIEELKAILTYYIRAERFCEGTWADAAENKIFLHILYRLKELFND